MHSKVGQTGPEGTPSVNPAILAIPLQLLTVAAPIAGCSGARFVATDPITPEAAGPM